MMYSNYTYASLFAILFLFRFAAFLLSDVEVDKFNYSSGKFKINL